MVWVSGEWKERVSSDSSMSNKTRQPRLGIARIGVIRNGTFWSGLAVEVLCGKLRQGSVCRSADWLGSLGGVRYGTVRRGKARRGSRGGVWSGTLRCVRYGQVRQSRYVPARTRLARRGVAWFGSQGLACHAEVSPGLSGYGELGFGRAVMVAGGFDSLCRP